MFTCQHTRYRKSETWIFSTISPRNAQLALFKNLSTELACETFCNMRHERHSVGTSRCTLHDAPSLAIYPDDEAWSCLPGWQHYLNASELSACRLHEHQQTKFKRIVGRTTMRNIEREGMQSEGVSGVKLCHDVRRNTGHSHRQCRQLTSSQLGD